MTDEILRAALEAAQQSSDFHGVIELTTALSERHPDDWRLLFTRGLARIQVAAYADAARDFQRIMALTTESSNACYNLAFCQMKLGELPAAISGFRAYLATDPGDADSLQNLALCEERLRQPPQPETLASDELSGRDVLRALGGFLVGLALTAAGFGVMFLGMQLGVEHAYISWSLIGIGFCGFLVAAIYAIQRKVEFAVKFWCWFFPWIFSIRAGRSIVGAGSLALGGWMAWGYYGALYEHGHFRLREFLAASSVIAVALLVGVGLLLSPGDAEQP